jgi:Rrf2 family protein
MLELALQQGRGPVFLKDVAKHQEISEKYLGHLIPPLKAAGLINSIRGAHGGYCLAKSPEHITLGEIIQTVEGTLAIVDCIVTPGICSRISQCVTREIWEEINEKIISVLNNTTLKDMVKRQQQKIEEKEIMYNI